MRSRDAQQIAETYILVAEDDRIARLVLEKMLAQAGYQSCFVVDGREAIDALKLMDYDLVLMDCYMPRLDGFAATHLIRNANKKDINPDIPVIAMTGLNGEGDRRRCLDAGMNDYIAKPIVAAELAAMIERHLGGKADQESVAQHETSAREPAWDDVFLDTLIGRFLADIPDVVASLQCALDGNDPHELERIGHRLRGASDILGLAKLSARSRSLEQAGKAGDLPNAGSLVSAVIAELDQVSALLKNEL